MNTLAKSDLKTELKELAIESGRIMIPETLEYLAILTDDSEEQCAEIVRRCNAFPELLEALDKADELHRMANLLACSRPEDRNAITVSLATAQHEYKQAREAIR